MIKDDQRWWNTMKDDERWSKMMKYYERWWHTIKLIMKYDELLWKMMKDDERWWNTMKSGSVFVSLVAWVSRCFLEVRADSFRGRGGSQGHQGHQGPCLPSKCKLSIHGFCCRKIIELWRVADTLQMFFTLPTRIADDRGFEFSKIVKRSLRFAWLPWVRCYWCKMNHQEYHCCLVIINKICQEGILSSSLRITYEPTRSILVVISPNNPQCGL